MKGTVIKTDKAPVPRRLVLPGLPRRKSDIYTPE